MSSYADTSFLVSLYGRDVNSRSAMALVEAHRPIFMVTPFVEIEFISVVYAVTARPKGWTVRDARTIEENFTHDLQMGVWQWENFPLEAWSRTRELARRYAPNLGCRALDALHVASALALAADDFYTFDQDQSKLARAAGLRVVGV